MKSHSKGRRKEANRWNRILILFWQPLTPLQLSKMTQESVKFINYVLEELAAIQLAECINPEARKGRIYILTEKGIKKRKKLLAQNRAEAESMLRKTGTTWDYKDLMPDTDILCYSCVMASNERQEFVRVMRKISILKGYVTAPDILAFYRKESLGISRVELYRRIKVFINKGMLIKFNIGKRNTGFRFTQKGMLIASQV